MRLVSTLLFFVCCSTGCSTIMHELQPHRMWRWNYQEPPGRTDGVYFSVEDRLPESSREAAHPGTTVQVQSLIEPAK